NPDRLCLDHWKRMPPRGRVGVPQTAVSFGTGKGLRSRNHACQGERKRRRPKPWRSDQERPNVRPHAASGGIPRELWENRPCCNSTNCRGGGADRRVASNREGWRIVRLGIGYRGGLIEDLSIEGLHADGYR